MKKLVGLVALVLALGAAQSVEALTIGSTPGPANNQVIPLVEGFYGANFYLNAGGPLTFEVEFYGKEAQFLDAFYINNSFVFDNQNYAPGFTTTVLIAPGLMNFHFTINGGGPVAVNGANPDPSANVPNFFATLALGPLVSDLDTNIDGNVNWGGTTLWLALDDGGAGPDDNHDDIVIRMTLLGRDPGTFQVPDGGATLSLLGCALLGLGALRRRFNG